MTVISQILRDFVAPCRMPVVTVNLMHSATAGNDPFYERVVREYYDYTQQRHGKCPLIKRDSYGVALLELPPGFDEYFMSIEASARRNYKKAARNGYRFERIDYNGRLDDIAEIWRSTDVRQGRMPDHYIRGEVPECDNPTSNTDIHDYPYFGVLRKDTLFAYAGCLIAGEFCAIEHVLGHAGYQSDGIVPMLIIGIVEELIAKRRHVKYLVYDTWVGANRNMRRFKRKFGFRPRRVKWIPG